MIKQLLDNFVIEDHLGVILLVSFLIPFVIAALTFPAIFKLAEAKDLTDSADHRSSHSGTIPNLGGVGIFFSLVVLITIVGAVFDSKILLLVLGGMTILFFLGLKDDILILSPKKKFVGQLLAGLMLIIFTDTRISGFSGLLGITIIPYWLSVLFTLFVYVLVINAYNLIDGIDGLAGSMGLLAALCFGFLFYKTSNYSMLMLCVGLMGAILPFLKLNFSKTRKLFMGDTGSMIIGFIVAVFSVRFIGDAQLSSTSNFYDSAPNLVLSILFFPLLDTMRIFFIRLVIYKKSPFEADKNHLHHKFLKLGFSHKKTTSIIFIINLLLVTLAYWCKDFSVLIQLGILVLSGVVLYSVYFVHDWGKKVKIMPKLKSQLNLW